MHPSFRSQISRIKRFGQHLHQRRIRQINQCLQSSGVRRGTNATIQKGLPDSFRNTLATKVILMTLAKDKNK